SLHDALPISKQKKLLIGIVIILAVFAVLLSNALISTSSLQANPKQIEISNVYMTRDVSYNGEDPDRDWNTTISMDIKSKNVFFKPVADELLVSNDGNGNLSFQLDWSFSLFHIFDTDRTVRAYQSSLIEDTISNDQITLELY